jgi:hypothetical protein
MRDEEKRFMTLTPGVNVIKNFTAAIYEFLKLARVFVPGKTFQPSLMFVGKAIAFPIKESFSYSTLG